MIELIFLGTTAGIPTKQRAHSAIVLKYEGDVILFDCGEGTQRQLSFANISPMKIKKIFITHWHADHFIGIAGLFQTLSLLGRKETLYIYGPKETRKFINIIANKLGYFNKTYEIVSKNIKNGLVFKNEKYKIKAIQALHSVPSLSYKFIENDKPGRFNIKRAKKFGLKKDQYYLLQKGIAVKVNGKKIYPYQVLGKKKKGKVIVYSGDTLFNENLIEFSKNADLLIHESTYTNSFKKRAKKVFHSTTKDAAIIAKKANVKNLILTHISGRYKKDEEILSDAKKIFKNVKVAKDFMKITLK